MLPVTKIVCPTDFSESSMAALDAACELAKHFDAELKILHVLPSTPTFPSNVAAAAALRYLPSNGERRDQAWTITRASTKRRARGNRSAWAMRRAKSLALPLMIMLT